MNVRGYEFGHGQGNFPDNEIQRFHTHKMRWPMAPPAPLTVREQFIMRLVAQGYTNRIIAEQSFISVNTVKFHMKNIFAKLGARTRTHAVQLYRHR